MTSTSRLRVAVERDARTVASSTFVGVAQESGGNFPVAHSTRVLSVGRKQTLHKRPIKIEAGAPRNFAATSSALTTCPVVASTVMKPVLEVDSSRGLLSAKLGSPL